MDNEKFGIFIAHLRKEKQLTQKNLADLLGVTNKAISKWERGYGFPEISILPALAEALDVSVDELLRGEKNEHGFDAVHQSEQNRILPQKQSEDQSLSSMMFLVHAAYHKFTNHLIWALWLAVLGLICFYTITFVTLYEKLGFGIQLTLLTASIVLVFTLINRLHHSLKSSMKMVNADVENNEIRNIIRSTGNHLRRALWVWGISFILPLPYILFDHSAYAKSILAFEEYVLIVPFFLLFGGIVIYFGQNVFLNQFYDRWGIEAETNVKSDHPALQSIKKFNLMSAGFFFSWVVYMIVIIVVIETIFSHYRPSPAAAIILLFLPLIIYGVYIVRSILKETETIVKIFMNAYIFRDAVSFGLLVYALNHGFSFSSEYGMMLEYPIRTMIITFFCLFIALTIVIAWLRDHYALKKLSKK